MAGMRGDGKFQQARSDEEYQAAIDMAIAHGHGGVKLASEQFGIPLDTLYPKVRQYRQDQGLLEPGETPPLPDGDAFGEMAELAINAMWHELHRIASPEAIQSRGKVDIKALADLATCAKNWTGIGKLKPATKTKASALSVLGGSKSESGSIAA